MINQNLLLAGDDGYLIQRSLRFRSSASAYLSRTPSSAGNRRTFTWSGWVKLGLIDANYHSFFANGNAVDSMVFWNDNTLALTNFNGTSYLVRTTQVFRDPSAWYHLVIAFDTTQATASNRIKIYVNGVQVTSFVASTYPSQNYDTGYNTTTAQYIAYNEYNRFDGYMAETNFIDGQALTPSSFGETDTITGVWKPKAFTGTYGTNGFYLPFTDVATTSGSNAGLGKDFSGNGNYWTTNNISVTAGTTYDSMTDVPTLTSATQANYAVFNPLWRLGGSGYITPTNGNLRASIAATNNIIASTIPIPTTGKWYMEFTLTSAVYPEYGLCGPTANGGGGATNIYGAYYNGSNLWFANGSNGSSDGNVANTTGDIGLIAVDVDNNKLWIGRNRGGTVVWMGGGNPSSGTSPSFSASGGGGVYATTFNAQTFNNPFVASGAGSDVWDANFGQQGFAGTPPTGFVALNTFNLPEPSIKQGNKHFDATTYTGTGTSTPTSVALSFQPDLVWGKCRNAADHHFLVDAVRGNSKYLRSSTTEAEADVGQTMIGFNSSGFTAEYASYGNGAFNYVGWAFKGGNTTSSNTAGSITSTVSANPTAGFSVVTYSANGSTGTVGHGLGVAPSMIIVKKRNAAERWCVYHTSTSNAYLYLNETFAAETGNANIRFGNNSVVVQPTSSVFTIGSSNDVNGTSGTYVAYCFSEVAGYSKFGSYTGNGSTDGPFVYTGFRPKFVMIKNTTNGAADWVTWDSSRNTYNLTNAELNPNTSGAEVNYNTADFLSNGFKLRSTYGNTNGSGSTLIYMAFAESPFRYSIAR